MRKTLSLLLALLISTSILAQNRSVLLRETFNSFSAPLGWTSTENSYNNWSISSTNFAGGEANELKFSSTPQAVGVSRIITSPVDLTGLSSVAVSFRHFFDKKSMSALIGIATSSNGGQTWSMAWSQTYSEAGQYTVIKSVKTPDMGKPEVLFCIYFQGNSTNINNWYFDDLEITTLEETDAKAESIDMLSIIPAGENEIVFSMQNTGINEITSFEASFEIGGKTVTETFETKLAQFETKQFTFENKVKLTPDIYTAKLEIGAVNGQNDNNLVNNTSKKSITVALGGAQKLPMIEHFSSSTCASCVPLDEQIKAFVAENPGKYTYTKYPMNWPNPGDPYYTQEGNVRKNYYNVGSVPFLALDGKSYGYKMFSQEELDARYNETAFINIKGAFNVNENNISLVADVMSYVDMSDIKVYISLNEKTTHNNASTNGLTSFNHIMMKMFDNAEGNPVDIAAGEYQRYEFTYDLGKTFVEETEDLEVAVWIQDVTTKEIYNSAYLYEYIEHPYPVQNLTLTNSDNLQISWEAPEKGTPTGYNLYVNNELVLENTTELSYIINDADGMYVAEVVALYENDVVSVGVAEKVIVGCHAPVNVEAQFEPFIQNFDFMHRVTLTWDAVNEAESYNVYVNGEKLAETTETTYVTGFDNSGNYIYTITSVCNAVESEHSEPCVVSLDNASIEENNILFDIYPNPVKSKLYIETDYEINEVSIYNVAGINVLKKNKFTDNYINVDNLDRGLYIIKISTKNGDVVRRFVKE